MAQQHGLRGDRSSLTGLSVFNTWLRQTASQSACSLGFGLLVAGVMFPVLPSVAAIRFEHREISQSRFILVASPIRRGNAHQLLILEQISNQRPCWQESGRNPVTVDPLLTTFDFTGICGRSTDSNGYSIRVAGQDLALRYRLSVVRQDNDLLLVGVPTRDRNAPTLTIGRTNGYTPGFAKIQLLPGWRLTQRTFDGQALSHFYLTRNQMPPESENLAAVPVATVPTTRISPTVPASRPTPPPTAIDIPVVLETAKSRPEVPPTTPANRLDALRSTPSIPSGSQFPAPSRPTVVASLPTPTPPTTSSGITASSFPMPASLNRRGGGSSAVMPPPLITFPVAATPTAAVGSTRPAPLPVARNSTPPPPLPNNPNRPSASNLLPVPSRRIPSGNPGQRALATLPPPPVSPQALGVRYRVVVAALSADQESQIRSLIPDAFPIVSQGRRVLQAGAFSDRARATELLQLLMGNGLNAAIETSN